MFDGGGCSAPIFCVLGPLLLSNFQPRIDPMVGSAYSMSVRRQKAEGERQKGGSVLHLVGGLLLPFATRCLFLMPEIITPSESRLGEVRSHLPRTEVQGTSMARSPKIGISSCNG